MTALIIIGVIAVAITTFIAGVIVESGDQKAHREILEKRVEIAEREAMRLAREPGTPSRGSRREKEQS
jgi:hypothetical protein